MAEEYDDDENWRMASYEREFDERPGSGERKEPNVPDWMVVLGFLGVFVAAIAHYDLSSWGHAKKGTNDSVATQPAEEKGVIAPSPVPVAHEDAGIKSDSTGINTARRQR